MPSHLVLVNNSCYCCYCTGLSSWANGKPSMSEDVVVPQKPHIKYIWEEDLYLHFPAFVNGIGRVISSCRICLWKLSQITASFPAEETLSRVWVLHARFNHFTGRRHKALMARLRGPSINCVCQVTGRHVSVRLVASPPGLVLPFLLSFTVWALQTFNPSSV